MPLAEVVENHDLVAPLLQGERDMAPHIAGAAGHQVPSHQ